MRNNNDFAVKIFRNFRFEKLIEMNNFNVCLIELIQEIAKLTIKHSKQVHKFFDFKMFSQSTQKLTQKNQSFQFSYKYEENEINAFCY